VINVSMSTMYIVSGSFYFYFVSVTLASITTTTTSRHTISTRTMKCSAGSCIRSEWRGPRPRERNLVLANPRRGWRSGAKKTRNLLLEKEATSRCVANCSSQEKAAGPSTMKSQIYRCLSTILVNPHYISPCGTSRTANLSLEHHVQLHTCMRSIRVSFLP